MKTKNILLKACIVLVAFGSTSVVNASVHKLYTLSGFVDLLIEKGIIAGDNIEKARSVVTVVENTERDDRAQNSGVLEVSVSQYIERGTLTFNKFEDIEGLLLVAKNTSDTDTTFEAKRGCQVTYKVYSVTDELVYDSSTKKDCATDEVVTYALGAGESRLFEITHKRTDFALQAGEYRFVIEYPGYGEGEKEVTIQ